MNGRIFIDSRRRRQSVASVSFRTIRIERMRHVFKAVLWILAVLLHEAVARVAVVVDAVLRLEFLNELESPGGMRTGDSVAQRFAGMQQDFLQAAVDAHVLVFRQVAQESGQSLLKTDGEVYALNLERRTRFGKTMPEHESMAAEISDHVIA